MGSSTIISFYEEFPTNVNLNKLKLITWKTKLYLAAPSLKEFNKIVTKIKTTYTKESSLITEFVYWPILDNKEGYWISPFSKKSALQRIFSELKNTNVPVMLDLELPTTRNPILYFTQLLNFFSNKKRIRKFIKEYKSKIYLVEYYPNGKWGELFLKTLGIHYNIPNTHIIKMFYHSLHNFNKEFFIQEMKRGIKESGSKFIPSFGTIAKGIHGTEPILSSLQLKEDIQLARNQKVAEVIIFRLGGLNKEYQKMIDL
jgi:hypothetical protein